MSEKQTLLKILLVGDSNVGKSTSFVDKEFTPGIASTIAYDFQRSSVTINDNEYALAIWDTAGEEKHHALSPIFYRGCHGVIIVYDITTKSSFEHINEWINNVDLYSRQPHVVKLLVGNKIDQPARAINRKDGQDFARAHGMLFLESSAKTLENVDQAFEELVRKITETPGLMETPKTGVDIAGSGQTAHANYSCCW